MAKFLIFAFLAFLLWGFLKDTGTTHAIDLGVNATLLNSSLLKLVVLEVVLNDIRQRDRTDDKSCENDQNMFSSLENSLMRRKRDGSASKAVPQRYER